MRVIQIGPPIVRHSGDRDLLTIEVPVTVDAALGRPVIMKLSCQASAHGTGRALERSAAVTDRLKFAIPRDCCRDGSRLTFSAAAEGEVLWQKIYRARGKKHTPSLEELG